MVEYKTSNGMQSEEIRRRFLAFFEKRGHTIIPSAPLVPLNDPSVLFNTAGMQPLVPYLLGQKHPQGTKLVDVQKCVRTGDLDDIGDNRHFSFFEMMGNWSLGDYFKKEAIQWSYEFLTSKDEGLGLDVGRLYFTIFEGDENAPFDQESKDIWMSMGIPEKRIYALPAEDNWWSPGDNGPCGPCSEMFYDMSGTVGDLSREEFLSAVKKEDVIEIWNDVFMEFEKKDGKVIGKLAQKNVDTGAGLERITAVMQGKKTAYDTDLLEEAMVLVKNGSAGEYNEKYGRIVVDHMRTALFMVADGVIPGNKGREYILRRLIRRANVRLFKLNKEGSISVSQILDCIVHKYSSTYPEILAEKNKEVILDEIIHFGKTLKDGIKHFNVLFHDNKIITGYDAFVLYTTYGFPIELTIELIKESEGSFDFSEMEKFNEEMRVHQKLSQTASAGMFKGGLANHNEATVRLHTAHHLLLAALQEVLGKDVKQRGSNITEERLRIDFSFERKMTDDEKRRVEEIVNKHIQDKLNVVRREMPRADAEKLGAEMEFGVKYPDVVSVYFIEDANGNPISKEFCGGPHVKNTSELGANPDGAPKVFKIQKEEASSQGVRRIKAVLQ